MNAVYAGASGFSYKEWKGPFFRIPRRNVLENWREDKPDNFRFVIKASRALRTSSAKLMVRVH